jgi:putative membrane protein
MNLKSMRIMMLGTVTMLLPITLLGQPGQEDTTSSIGQSNQTQPGQPGPSNQPQPGPGQQQNARPSMQDSVGSSGDHAQTIKDKMFLRQAAEGGMAEVQFGQLATQKGGSDDVKAFGQKMVDDHTALNKEMGDVADTAGVMLPKHVNKEDQAEYDKLNGLSGDEFDTEYLTLMVKDHHKDLREFRMESASTQDPALREAVVKGQRVIHGHLVMVDKLAKSKGIEVPGRGGTKPPPTPVQ